MGRGGDSSVSQVPARRRETPQTTRASAEDLEGRKGNIQNQESLADLLPDSPEARLDIYSDGAQEMSYGQRRVLEFPDGHRMQVHEESGVSFITYPDGLEKAEYKNGDYVYKKGDQPHFEEGPALRYTFSDGAVVEDWLLEGEPARKEKDQPIRVYSYPDGTKLEIYPDGTMKNVGTPEEISFLDQVRAKLFYRSSSLIGQNPISRR